jgi:hypothetical protein
MRRSAPVTVFAALLFLTSCDSGPGLTQMVNENGQLTQLSGREITTMLIGATKQYDRRGRLPIAPITFGCDGGWSTSGMFALAGEYSVRDHQVCMEISLPVKKPQECFKLYRNQKGQFFSYRRNERGQFGASFGEFKVRSCPLWRACPQRFDPC